MNTSITSKEAILEVCRSIVAKKGLLALNMRAVSDECHIALGTLYNYYANKDELLLATVESIWKDIFHMGQKCEREDSFSEYVRYLFECVQKGVGEYPDFFATHSISLANSEKGKAKRTMQHYFTHMKDGLLKVLSADQAVAKDVFSQSFTEEAFVGFVLDNILLLLVQREESCDTLVDIISRVIYR
ncbi:MAG: TetR/AcrR family transcriptional regulator [Bariatricus sp.]